MPGEEEEAFIFKLQPRYKPNISYIKKGGKSKRYENNLSSAYLCLSGPWMVPYFYKLYILKVAFRNAIFSK